MMNTSIRLFPRTSTLSLVGRKKERLRVREFVKQLVRYTRELLQNGKISKPRPLPPLEDRRTNSIGPI